MDRSARRQWTAVDAALLHLIRLVLDDTWTAPVAAEKLGASVSGDFVLRSVRARVRSALADRPTPVAHRAAATLDLLLGAPALGTGGPHHGVGTLAAAGVAG